MNCIRSKYPLIYIFIQIHTYLFFYECYVSVETTEDPVPVEDLPLVLKEDTPPPEPVAPPVERYVSLAYIF